MKVSLTRNVGYEIDILVDKSFETQQSAHSFFNKVLGNLKAKGFKEAGKEVFSGRQFIRLFFNKKPYILGLY